MNLNEEAEVNPVRDYIGFKINGRVFTSLWIQKSKMWVGLYNLKETFTDPKGLILRLSDSYNWGNISRFGIKNLEEVDYAIGLIKQSHDYQSVKRTCVKSF